MPAHHQHHHEGHAGAAATAPAAAAAPAHGGKGAGAAAAASHHAAPASPGSDDHAAQLLRLHSGAFQNHGHATGILAPREEVAAMATMDPKTDVSKRPTPAKSAFPFFLG